MFMAVESMLTGVPERVQRCEEGDGIVSIRPDGS